MSQLTIGSYSALLPVPLSSISKPMSLYNREDAGLDA